MIHQNLNVFFFQLRMHILWLSNDFFYNHQRPDMTRVSLFSFAMDFDVYNSYVVISGIFSSVKSKKMLVIILSISSYLQL